MYEVYIDGGTAGNPSISGAGVFIKGHGIVEQHAIPLGVMSNHEAEFYALIHGLTICKEKQYDVLSFRSDSQLVVNAVEKRHVKKEVFAPLLEQALQLIDTFELFFIKWIPQSQNTVADKLAKKAIHDQ